MDHFLTQKARDNVSDILSICIKHDKVKEKALVIYDDDDGLTNILTEAYREALPDAHFVNFNKSNKEEILSLFSTLSPGDLVVLIQSTNFLLNEFRIRLHLFNNHLKVIEHMHLARNEESMWETYVNSLQYDKDWYPVVAPKIKKMLDEADKLVISSGGKELILTGGLEPAMLNIGDYTGMANIGGTFPIGEVFTEGKIFEKLNGEVYIYAFADKDFNVQMYEPFLITISEGKIVSVAENAPALFKEILELVKMYERPIIREIGFGLNKAISKEKPLSDITAFERVLGMHLSLGEKHSIYKKEGMTTNKTKFHIDIFPVVDLVLLDEKIVFKNGTYLPPSLGEKS
jgi:aminopeptidase